MSRFFVAPEDIGARTIEITDKGDLHHMRKVLRMKPGDEVDVSDSDRFEYRARIETLEADSALLTILDKQAFAREPETKVTLFQGIPKQGKMEAIVQKCVELGVYEIVPVFMERTVVVDKGKMGRKTERWQKVASEAVKQCRRGIIPQVREPQVMKEVIGELGTFDLVIIPYENEEKTTIKQVLKEFVRGSASSEEHLSGKRIAVIIGPEGGFSDDEVDSVLAAGGHSATLGRTTLRTETAGPAALAMINYELEL